MLGHRFLASSLLFVVLLNMKHIFIYCALPYFVYLLSTFCYPFHKHQVRAMNNKMTYHGKLFINTKLYLS